jgi:hypothetical protein
LKTSIEEEKITQVEITKGKIEETEDRLFENIDRTSKQFQFLENEVKDLYCYYFS